MVREYFLKYNEAMTNDFVLSEGGRKVELMSRDLDDWRITFVDTGMHSNLGSACCGCASTSRTSRPFLANYSDGLSDLPLDKLIADFQRRDVIGTFAAVHNSQSFHCVRTDEAGTVTDIGESARPTFGSTAATSASSARSSTTFAKARNSSSSPSSASSNVDSSRPTATRASGSDGHLQGQDHLRSHGGAGECPWMVWKR
jgi:glucose-1-phosphate cytidylyltransferase